ncbi:hypothetical protein HPJ99_06870 [Anoxybacillus flavithermus]|uniref:Phage protein n=1 Tax=Anoxybacillus flavithermus TaxID=33934 RepID=A0A178TEK9_9BACL|nr:hypothetical protein [Anoxybacillus flavithermus]MBE2905405.1 hypothetical protein [Anoxybacillus flavithermus]MBE2923906.1 hypothetical protein [Anoxybacillus flavithermus]MBE2934955.1 hypothetical protein [Anoxybacillus flavithermus]MBE2945890.1 hypothetical protein [Anoxybacillus flavithermus]MBE2948732.1 hypothetical protein [Anoxybacillus flavithermus]
MTQAELYQALKSIGYPVAYSSFSSPVTPPFITYQFAYSNDLIADNINYVSIDDFQIELYTAKKDLVAEQKVQDKLKELGLPYRKFEAYLDSEKLFQIIYEIQILGG